MYLYGMPLQEGGLGQFPSWHMGLQIPKFHLQNNAKLTLKMVTNIQFYRHSKASWCLTAVSLKL